MTNQLATKVNLDTMIKLHYLKEKKMIIKRKLGHRVRIPGVGQWQILTNETDDECWVCDRHIISVVIWTDLIGPLNDE